MSITNFDASASTEPTQRHHEVLDQWLLMQRTEVQNKCAENKAVRTDLTCISRNQRDILWISWNIGCNLVFVRFSQNVKSTFCAVSQGFKIGIVYKCSPKTTTDEQFPMSTCSVRVLCYHVSQLCRGMTPTYHRAALKDTVFERKCFQARFLVFQAKTRGRRASQGVVDTTTVHHQSRRNLSRFRLPVLPSCPNRTSLSHKRMQTASPSPSPAA